MPPVENVNGGGGSGGGGGGGLKSNVILFDSTKNELFRLNDNYKTLQRKLKANWKVRDNFQPGKMSFFLLKTILLFQIKSS